jgi:C4-dicarboxylate-specific signal transduction histidine kinase
MNLSTWLVVLTAVSFVVLLLVGLGGIARIWIELLDAADDEGEGSLVDAARSGRQRLRRGPALPDGMVRNQKSEAR